jgi:hypothetical protein
VDGLLLSFVLNWLTFAVRFSDMVLRRYLFNVDWSKKVPNISAACRCKDVYQACLAYLLNAKVACFFFFSHLPYPRLQKFRQGLKDVVAKKRASSKRSNSESLVFVSKGNVIGMPENSSNAGQEVFTAEKGANEAFLSKEVMKMETKVEIGLNLVPSTESLCFYEVRCKLRIWFFVRYQQLSFVAFVLQ